MTKEATNKNAFQALCRRVIHLHHLWHEYATLFRQPAFEETQDLMNRTAPTFFHLVQQTWLDQLFLEIGRLMYPAGSGDKETLGFASLLARIDDPFLDIKVEPVQQPLKKLCAEVSVWRNKCIAHNDWKYFMGSRPLPDVEIDNIEKLIFGLEEVTNVIAQHCFGYNVSCKPDSVKGGAEKLLLSLSKWHD